MKHAIGIDPGSKTGLAIWDMEAKKWDVILTTTAIEAEELVKLYHENGGCMVIVEDARKRQWFGNTGRERLQGAGYAKATSKRWEDFLKHNRIPHRMQKPGKTWKGAVAGKTWASIVKWDKPTTDHARDAAWLVFEISKVKMEALCGMP